MSGDFNFLKGNIETIILNSLYNKDKYGYEIARDIKEKTDNKYEIKQPTLYSYLKRLEDSSMIESYWGESSNGGRRKYYKLTESGKSQCDDFVAEWNYHKDILDTLVVEGDEHITVEQQDVTPLFGSKIKKRTKKAADNHADQEEVARKLAELENSQEATQAPITAPNTFIIQNDNTDYEKQTSSDSNCEYVASKTVQENSADVLARFEVKQDSAESFINNFEALANDVASHGSDTTGENYQHVLMGMLGDQLDEIKQDQPSQLQTNAYTSDVSPQQLEEVAETLSKDGIKIRIYNHTTANYKPRKLLCLPKLLAQTAWLTFAVAFVYFGLFAILSIGEGLWQQFVASCIAIFAIAVGLTVYAIIKPLRKEKPPFQFRTIFTASLIICLSIVLLSFGLGIVTNAEFDAYAVLCNKIFLPTGFAILLPVYTLFFNIFYKRY